MKSVGNQVLLLLMGLAMAGWGHLLLADRRLAAAAWRWLDDRFPPAWRSPTPVAGGVLLAMGAACIIVAVAN